MPWSHGHRRLVQKKEKKMVKILRKRGYRILARTYIYKVPFRDVCDVKSRGTQVEKGHEGNTAVVTAYVGGNMEDIFHVE